MSEERIADLEAENADLRNLLKAFLDAATGKSGPKKPSNNLVALAIVAIGKQADAST